MVVEYNGTTGAADAGYSSRVSDLNIFYDVRLSSASGEPPFSRPLFEQDRESGL